MKDDTIRKVALDIGNNRIKLLVGEISSDFQKIAVTKYVNVESRGIQKSVIENSEQLAEAIGEAIRKAESLEDPITKVSIALGGSKIFSSTVNVKLSFPEREIEEADIDNLLKQAKKEVFSGKAGEYRILYKEVYNKKLDRPGIVKQPIGMISKELQADVHFIYVEEDYVQKITQIINKIGVDVGRVYLNSYASAKGTLDKEAWKKGVVFVDIGYGSTSVIILKYGKVLYAKTISLGKMHYISDLTYKFKISTEEAERIVQKLINKEFEADNTIRCGTKKILLRDIRDVISARTEDIIEFIKSTIEIANFDESYQKGIILTGGTVEIEGIFERIASRFNYLVRKMEPIPLKGLSNPSYSDAVVIGIFLEDMEKEYQNHRRMEKEKEKTSELESEKNLKEIPSDDRNVDKKNNIKTGMKEEIDVFLEEIKEIEDEEVGKLEKILKWVKELF